jgi:hypothetical protein
MGVDKMAPEDQHGGYSHPTSHSTSSDLGASLYTSWTDSMAILTCVGPREQVLVSTSLAATLHFPPRSGCLAVAGDGAVLWPQVADDPDYRLESPALGIHRRHNQAFGCFFELALWSRVRWEWVSMVEMGVEEKIAPEDQHGGYSHPTSHSTSSDPISPSTTSLANSVQLLVGIEARQQVFFSTLCPFSASIWLFGCLRGQACSLA